MSQKYLFLLLALCLSCAERSENESSKKDEPKALKGPFRPSKYSAYENVMIMPEYELAKDTFEIGEEFSARIFFNENVEMLKRVAKEANLDYKIKYYSTDIFSDQEVEVNPAVDDSYAEVHFEIVPDTVKERSWKFGIKFAFEQDGQFVYDTTIARTVKYFVEPK